MLRPLQYGLICALAAACVVVVAINAGLYFTNRAAQAHVSARAQYIQQSQAIGALYQQIAKSLANVAVEHHDEEIKALLAGEGFTITPAPATRGAVPSGDKP